jgi:hypothetical protein
LFTASSFEELLSAPFVIGTSAQAAGTRARTATTTTAFPLSLPTAIITTTTNQPPSLYLYEMKHARTHSLTHARTHARTHSHMHAHTHARTHTRTPGTHSHTLSNTATTGRTGLEKLYEHRVSHEHRTSHHDMLEVLRAWWGPDTFDFIKVHRLGFCLVFNRTYDDFSSSSMKTTQMHRLLNCLAFAFAHRDFALRNTPRHG